MDGPERNGGRSDWIRCGPLSRSRRASSTPAAESLREFLSASVQGAVNPRYPRESGKRAVKPPSLPRQPPRQVRSGGSTRCSGGADASTAPMEPDSPRTVRKSALHFAGRSAHQPSVRAVTSRNSTRCGMSSSERASSLVAVMCTRSVRSARCRCRCRLSDSLSRTTPASDRSGRPFAKCVVQSMTRTMRAAGPCSPHAHGNGPFRSGVPRGARGFPRAPPHEPNRT